MRPGIVVSALLHVGVLTATMLSWPHAIAFPEEETPVVPVELVTLDEKTNITPTVAEPPSEAPPPEQTASLDQPQETTPEPVPQEAEPEPAPPEPEKPAEQPKPPEPEKQAEVKAPPPPPMKPREKPKPEPKQKFDVDSVLALLDKTAPKQAPPAKAKAGERTTPGIGDRNAMTMDLKDALLAQMRECWNVPAGAPHPEQLIVQVRVFLAPDGTLSQPPHLEHPSSGGGNPYMRSAEEAALRAVRVCEPYKNLPRDRYDAWREIVMTFDPSKMVGR